MLIIVVRPISFFVIAEKACEDIMTFQRPIGSHNPLAHSGVHSPDSFLKPAVPYLLSLAIGIALAVGAWIVVPRFISVPEFISEVNIFSSEHRVLSEVDSSEYFVGGLANIDEPDIRTSPKFADSRCK